MTYVGGTNLALPAAIVPLSGGGDGIGWRVAPFRSVGVGYSPDLPAGGFLGGGGGVSSLRFRHRAWKLTMANQVTYDTGIPITAGDITYKTKVDAWLIKNGVDATYRCTPGILLDGGAAYSDSLKKAAVQDLLAASGGVNFEFGKGSGVHLGYRRNFGHGYHDNGGNVEVYFRL
jgi:hypothetical protein